MIGSVRAVVMVVVMLGLSPEAVARWRPRKAAAAAAAASAPYTVRLAELERRIKNLKERVWTQPRRHPRWVFRPLGSGGPSQGQRAPATR